jgi:molecular chaperone DnaK
MLSWLKFWRRGKPAQLPSAEEVAKRAPTCEAIRIPPAGTTTGAPRYSFTAFDSTPPRCSARRSSEAPPPAGGPEPILGIDLGTTHAVAAVVQDRRITLLANQEGELLTPCVVARSAEGDWLVGEPARRQALSNPKGTVRSFKRLLGAHRHVLVGEQNCPPQQLAALVLRKLREAAEARLGHRVRRAVITIPAGAGAVARQATLEAAEIAGLETEWDLVDPRTGQSRRLPTRILAKSTAAALGFGLTRAWTHDRRVAVLHLGGGSFGVSLLQIGDGVFQVQAVGGAVDLGGDDLDTLLVNDLAVEIEGRHHFDPRTDPVASQRLLVATEQARRDLSAAAHADIVLPCFASLLSGPWTLRTTLTRQRLEQLARPLLDRCRDTITQALADACWQASDVEEVSLTGGLTRMPLFRALVRQVFGASQVRVQPPEIVAAGAAIQGHQLQLGGRSDVLLVDVASLSLRVETADGKASPLVERGTSIPTTKSRRLVLPTHQGEARASIFQGEIDRPVRSAFLGEIRLAQVLEESTGQASVDVTCELDVSGQVEVTLKDPRSGRSQTSLVRASTGLEPVEIARLLREAEQERLFQAWSWGADGR